MGLMLTKAAVPEKSASALLKAVDIAIQPAIKAFKCGDTLSVKGRNKVFEEQLVERDMRISCAVVEVRCSITGLLLPSYLVVAAHIFPLRAEEYVNGFCPGLVDINSVENGLLWAEVIELAFENSALMFDWNEDMKILTPYVLDRNVLQTNMDVARKYLMQQCGYSKKGSDDISIVSSLFSTSSPSGEGTSMPEVVPYTMEQITNIVEGVEPSQRTRTYKLFCMSRTRDLYRGISFGDIHAVPIQLQQHVSLCSEAFLARAVTAISIAEKRGVLPPGFTYERGVASPIGLVLQPGGLSKSVSAVDASCVGLGYNSMLERFFSDQPAYFDEVHQDACEDEFYKFDEQ